VTAQQDTPWWASDPAVLEAVWRISAREHDWEGCEAALKLMASTAADPGRAELLYQVLRVAAAGGTLVMPTASERTLAIEKYMVEAKAKSATDGAR
jgi:hypothetical protein